MASAKLWTEEERASRGEVRKGGNGMEVFGMVGMSFGTMGFIFALNALAKISKLEKQLTETGVLDKEYKSG